MKNPKIIKMTVELTLEVPEDTPIENLCMTRPLFQLECPNVRHGILVHETVHVCEVDQENRFLLDK